MRTDAQISDQKPHQSLPWQPVLAALANEYAMKVYARQVLIDTPAGMAETGVPYPVDARERQALNRLVAVGLLDPDTFLPIPGALARVLAANATPKREGIERFFESGMLTRLPMNAAQRLEVLEHLAQRLIPTETDLAELDINRLLATVTRDIPTLRRALVDHGLLLRNVEGSRYRSPSHSFGS
ncbi:DUF2087 domain-containing protein [Arthrobacter cryoconiti]|uniref:DUF2087 domain-containing protein n=1 Tax=Arthrobacter cryoconiti TaxID=748907 RepID=A0ABV8R3K2_9MICC|nr:DUF2087 domain-containing protein [Arthrobacter cryoconiti]MCC9067094.1 DUF2087 domain-containing protein [Arthrobacter cryoconiti]